MRSRADRIGRRQARMPRLRQGLATGPRPGGRGRASRSRWRTWRPWCRSMATGRISCSFWSLTNVAWNQKTAWGKCIGRTRSTSQPSPRGSDTARRSRPSARAGRGSARPGRVDAPAPLDGVGQQPVDQRRAEAGELGPGVFGERLGVEGDPHDLRLRAPVRRPAASGRRPAARPRPRRRRPPRRNRGGTASSGDGVGPVRVVP